MPLFSRMWRPLPWVNWSKKLPKAVVIAKRTIILRAVWTERLGNSTRYSPLSMTFFPDLYWNDKTNRNRILFTSLLPTSWISDLHDASYEKEHEQTVLFA